MKNNKVYYVYFLKDPSNQKPFYVGKGKNKRAWIHLKIIKQGKNSDNPHRDNKIKKILKEGKEPIIEIVKSFLCEEEAYVLEELYIKKYGRAAFDKNGMRLGYGKGVYDRLLANFKGVKIGLGYDFQMLDE